MTMRKGITLEVGQEWTIGKRTRNLFENGINKMYALSNRPLISMGYECVITEIDRVTIGLMDKQSKINFTVKTHRLGKLIK